MTGLVLPTIHVTPNYALKNVMEQWCVSVLLSLCRCLTRAAPCFARWERTARRRALRALQSMTQRDLTFAIQLREGDLQRAKHSHAQERARLLAELGNVRGQLHHVEAAMQTQLDEVPPPSESEPPPPP
jgi:hypothetical protein